MSLDVYLRDENTNEVLYSANITHNLNTMAKEAGIYAILWRPEEVGITRADQIIAKLADGVCRLASNRRHYEQFNSPNGWGMWEHFLPFCYDYLQACRDNPDALVEVSR